MIGRNDGFKLGLAYGRLIPTPGTQNVCPLTPVLARYRSSDSKRRGKEKYCPGSIKEQKQRETTFSKSSRFLVY